MSTASRVSTFVTFAAAATLGTVCVTVISALVLTSAPGQVQATAGEVHQLPRVVVTGQVQRGDAVRVAQLPRVVVTGRVTPPSSSSPLLAEGEASTAPSL